MQRIILIIIFILNLSFETSAQNYLWTKTIGGVSVENYPTCKLQKDGTSILGWNAFGESEIDTFRSSNFGPNTFPLISKLDTNGKSIWMWEPDSFSGSVIIRDIVVSNFTNSIYICGLFRGLIKTSVGEWQNEDLERFTGFVMKLDQSGNFKSFYCLNNLNASIDFFDLKLVDKDKLLVTCAIRPLKSIKLNLPDFFLTINQFSSLILCFDSSLSPLKHSDVIVGVTNNLKMLTTDSNKLVVITTITDSIIVKEKTYNSFGYKRAIYGFVLNDSLNVVNVKYLCLSNDMMCYAATKLSNGTIIIGGTLADSIVYNNSSTYPLPASRERITLWAAFDKNFDFLWTKFPTKVSGFRGNHDIWALDANEEFYYGGGWLRGDNVYDDFALPDSLGKLWYFKGDKNGNILWMRRTNNSNSGFSIFNDISVNQYGKVLFTANLSGSAIIDDKIYYSNGSQDVLAICIKDIEIYRGLVSLGPYCAGDTLEVPFTINGSFDSSNIFIAQISDESGNFTGNEKEIGRINAFIDSTIKGVLPQFDMVSSQNYRIRIISTHPVVQSYYKLDSLRLLIYSKDTAYAGRDTAICFGNNIELSTTGGSRWHWSPGNTVSDSSLRQPLFSGLKTTRFRVIISDSSGCGVIDTAYKTVSVLEPLEILNTDTNVCFGKSVNLQMLATGGNPISYNYLWLNKNWDTLSNQRTFNFTPFSDTAFYLVLLDNCTLQNDTHLMNIFVPHKITFEMPADSIVCFETKIDLAIKSYGGLGEHFTHWLLPKDTTIDGNNKLSVFITNDTLFRFEVQDVCGSKSEKGRFKYRIHENIHLIAQTDTIVCFGSTVTFSSKAFNGKPPYGQIWHVKNVFKDSVWFDPNLQLVISEPHIAYLKVFDQCGTEQFDTFNIQIYQPLKLTYQGDSVVCENSSASLKAFVLGGKNPTISLTENYINQISNTYGNLDTFLIIQKPTNFELIANDNCTLPNDTLEFKINIFDKVISDFSSNPKDPTIYDTLILTPNDTNHTSYIWYKNNQKEIELPAPGIHTFRQKEQGTTEITLWVKSISGCLDSTVTTFHFIDGEFIFIPTSFSPNQDGLNDVFKPTGKSVFNYQIKIFDRFQTQLFDGANNEPWNGVKTRSGIDRYLYIITVTSEFGKSFTYKGLVTLVR